MHISIHLNLFTSTPFFDCLPLFFGSGMKPKIRARAAEWRSPRPWLTRFVHRGGLRCDDIDKVMEKKLTTAAEKTDIFFLSIGGNDISPISKPEKNYDDIKSLIEILKEAVYVGFLSRRSCRGPTSKKCSLWSYQVQIREGQEENKPKDRNSKGWWCNVVHTQGYLAHAHHRIGK